MCICKSCGGRACFAKQTALQPNRVGNLSAVDVCHLSVWILERACGQTEQTVERAEGGSTQTMENILDHCSQTAVFGPLHQNHQGSLCGMPGTHSRLMASDPLGQGWEHACESARHRLLIPSSPRTTDAGASLSLFCYCSQQDSKMAILYQNKKEEEGEEARTLMGEFSSFILEVLNHLRSRSHMTSGIFQSSVHVVMYL